MTRIPAGRVRYMGLMHMVTARSAKIGTRTFAVAVLEAMFVIDTETLTVKCFWIATLWTFCYCFVGGDACEGH